MLRVTLKCCRDVAAQPVGYVSEGFCDFRRHHLKSERRYEAYHFLIHQPITLFDPASDILMSEQFLDRDCQRPMERSKMVPEHFLFAKPEAVYDGYAMCTVQSYQCIRGIRVCSTGKPALQVGQLDRFVMCVWRLLLSWEFELSANHMPTRGPTVNVGGSRVEV